MHYSHAVQVGVDEGTGLRLDFHFDLARKSPRRHAPGMKQTKSWPEMIELWWQAPEVVIDSSECGNSVTRRSRTRNDECF